MSKENFKKASEYAKIGNGKYNRVDICKAFMAGADINKEALMESLELLWFCTSGFCNQGKVRVFFEKIGYDFYKKTIK